MRQFACRLLVTRVTAPDCSCWLRGPPCRRLRQTLVGGAFADPGQLALFGDAAAGWLQSSVMLLLVGCRVL